MTTRSDREVDPRPVGVPRASVERIWRSVIQYYRLGLQPAIAMCIRRRGQIIIDRAVGHARGNGPGASESRVLATPDTLFNMFSASKSVTAMVIMGLEEDGLLRLDAPVAEFIPRFTGGGKERVTIRHLLNHRAGIPAVSGEMLDPGILGDTQRVIDIICDARQLYAPGDTIAYHALTAGFLLGEIARQVTGRDMRALLDERVRRPLGFEHLSYGVSEERLTDVAEEAFTGPLPRRPLKNLLGRSLGVPMMRLVEIANDPMFLTSIVPSGNVVAPPHEVGRFFELLLRGGTLDGVKVFDERTIARAVAPQGRRQIDRIILLPLRYGLGFMLGSRTLSFYGRRTPRAFGHLGFTNVLAWADPERDISVAFMNNASPS